MSNPKSPSRAQRAAHRAQRKRKQQMRTLVSITIGAILVVAALVLPSLLQANNLTEPEPRDHSMANGSAIGDPNAPVSVIVFSDFQCSHCYDLFADVEPLLYADYIEPGIVYYIYRSFGAFLGAESATAAEAAYCASDQNMFWEMHDTIFTNYSSSNVGGYSEARLSAMAELIGLDTNSFESCLEDGKYADRVQQDYVDGQAASVRGTPAFLVNGQLVETGANYAALSGAIQVALANIDQ